MTPAGGCRLSAIGLAKETGARLVEAAGRDRNRLLCFVPVKEGRVEREVQDAEGKEQMGNQ